MRATNVAHHLIKLLALVFLTDYRLSIQIKQSSALSVVRQRSYVLCQFVTKRYCGSDHAKDFRSVLVQEP